jgi:hypothetical protein
MPLTLDPKSLWFLRRKKFSIASRAIERTREQASKQHTSVSKELQDLRIVFKD